MLILAVSMYHPAYGQMSGSYTIGPAGDYANFNAAVAALVAQGVSAPVVFEVAAGTYQEQVSIPAIAGASASNTITFQSAGGDSTAVVLQYSAGAAQNYVLALDSTGYVIFQSMTIKTLDATYANVVTITGTTSHVSLLNNQLLGLDSTLAVVLSWDATNNDLVIRNNLIRGGQVGIELVGEETAYETGTIISGNMLQDQSKAGIIVKYQQAEQITGNRITHDQGIEQTWVGINPTHCSGTMAEPALIANNMVSFNSTQKSAGIHLYSSNYQHIYYNSILVYGDAPDSRAFNQEAGGGSNVLKNNILSNTARGLVFYATDLSACSSDYNDLLTTGVYFAYSNGFINTMTDWQSATNKDSHSISADPLFVDSTDLHSRQLLLAGYGTAVAEVTTDIDNEPRPAATPTIGADELIYTCTTPMQGVHTIGANGIGEYGSFKEAVLALYSCGVADSLTFVVSAGTYQEQVAINGLSIHYPNGWQPVTFAGQTPTNDAHLQYAADAANNYTLMLDNAKKIHFQNMTLAALDTTYGRVIYLQHAVDSLSFSDNTITGINTALKDDNLACVYVANMYEDSLAHVQFTNNRIAYGSDGISGREWPIQKVFYLASDRNRFEGQSRAAIYLYAQRLTATGNNITGPAGYGISTTAYDTAVIAGNTINLTGDEGYGLEINAKAGIYNNFISLDNGWGGIFLQSSSSVVAFNTVLLHSHEDGLSACLFAQGAHATVLNNIFVNRKNERIIIDEIKNYQYITSDYNDIYSPNSNFDFDNYKASTGEGEHSISVMPQFVSDTDLHTHTAVLDSRGLPVAGITTDIDGDLRDAANPDIGADEFDNPQFYAGQDTVFCYYDQNFAQPAWVYDIGRGYDTYQWSNGSDSSAIVIDSQTPLGSTDYIVTVTTAGTSYTDTVTITYARPEALTQTDYCLNEGQELTITAAPNEAYLWSTGDTTRSITITAWTAPTVTVTDQYGCQNRGTVNIESNTHIARLNMPADTAICANQQLVLQANDYANNDVYDRYGFVWNTGDTTQVYTVDGSTTGAGTYLIKVQVLNKTTTLGCTTSDSVEVTVKPVADVVLSRDGDDLVVDYTDGTVYTWYWNYAEITSGLITRLTPDKNGDYFVEVIEANGCEARSNTLSFTITGIEKAAANVFHIYPNPSDGNFIIYYPVVANRPEVMILTAQGRLVYYDRAAATQQQVVHLQGLPSGVYVLRIRVDGRVFNQRLLIY